jgi:hypothetical protein
LHDAVGQQRRDHQALVGVLRSDVGPRHARIGRVVVDELRAAALQQTAEDAVAGLDHGGLERPDPLAQRGDRTVTASGRIRQEDRAAASREQLLGMTRDAIHHRTDVERRRQVAPDVGQRNGLARQALHLAEQARVLERDAHGRRHGAQQVHLGVPEGVRTSLVLEQNRPQRAIGSNDRNRDQRAFGLDRLLRVVAGEVEAQREDLCLAGTDERLPLQQASSAAMP